MTDTEITALAREYAEEKTDAISFKAYADPEFKKKLHIRGCANDAKEVIDWLTRRFFLVEKSVIKETWKEITNVYLAHQHITYDGARYLFNEVFFPEIAKEVER